MVVLNVRLQVVLRLAVVRRVGPWGCSVVLVHTIGCGQVEWRMVVLFVSAVGGAKVVVENDLSVCGSKIVQR